MYLNRILAAIVLIILCLQSWASTGLSRDLCLPIVKELETLSNVSPKEVEAKAPAALEKLRQGESPTFYYIAYNIYVENLFNQGKIDKASTELDTMINDAMQLDDPECQTIALRTQGQFYYKLGLYDRAADSFRKAMAICPRYDSDELESYFTWSSTLFWLVKAEIHNRRLDEAEKWLSEMDGMMLWLDNTGIVDKVGYKPVMILGLRARIALLKGDNDTARALLDECSPYMQPGIPSRAYVEYHIGEMELAVTEGRHADAIPILDELIDNHINDYKPIAATFLNQKANSLYQLGRYQESALTFMQYIDLQNQLDDISIAHQLDELHTLYDVENLLHERDLMQARLILAIIVCVALAVIIAIVIANQKRIRKKDMILAQNISNLHHLSKHPDREVNKDSNPASTADDELAAAPSPEYIAIGNSVVQYIKDSKCFLSADCGRETIKEALGISEQMLSKTLPLITGMTFVNYINRLRLDYAIELLERHPEITINKISAMCGFGTLRQFQRIFKQYYDLSPSAYREAWENSHAPKNTNADDPD